MVFGEKSAHAHLFFIARAAEEVCSTKPKPTMSLEVYNLLVEWVITKQIAWSDVSTDVNRAQIALGCIYYFKKNGKWYFV